MFKKISVAIVGFATLGVAYWLIAPFFVDRQVEESVANLTKPKILRQGTFEPLAGHSVEGTATLLKAGEKYYVRFEDGFKVTNGPDLFVYFGKKGDIVPEAALGALKGNIGSQNYEVPEGVNPADYDEVWVWCRAFTIPFGKAPLG